MRNSGLIVIVTVIILASSVEFPMAQWLYRSNRIQQGIGEVQLVSDGFHGINRRIIDSTHGPSEINSRAVVKGKETFCRSAVYIEGLGQGMLYSINYDYRLARHISIRAGFTRWSLPFIFFSDIQITGFPIMGNYLSGTASHHLELGIGVVPLLVNAVTQEATIFGADIKGGSANSFMVLSTTIVGYRYQPANGGFC
ncbi:MAG: hypothetical protein ACPL1K_01985, partial [Candidatus Kryptoniota bacterium]